MVVQGKVWLGKCQIRSGWLDRCKRTGALSLILPHTPSLHTLNPPPTSPAHFGKQA